jgi:peptide/nickel transport system ATP-binding protein
MAVGVIMNEDIEQAQVLAGPEHSTIHPNGALLRVQDLRVWFELRRWGFGYAGSVRAVDDVSFSLDYGEAIAVVGESGCGKTSLMKTILGWSVQPKVT